MSLEIVFVSYFSIAGANANNLPIVRFIPRSKIRFVMVVTPIDSFKILPTRRCFFFSIFFFAIAIFASNIGILGAVERITIVEVEIEVF